ncbi:MAG TPA: hypothetical protein VGX37_09285 [Allosphingosinicella sp.]|nr:hypothetical protein [Allosphingosinicella sp.]
MSANGAAKRLVEELLGPLHMHFLSARAAYRDYLDNGRGFRFASSLRRINGCARELLLNKRHLLPEEHQASAVALIGHYDAWMALWDEHAERLRPAPDDPFVFENRHTYPRDAEQRLEALYEGLGAGRSA